MKLMKKTTIIIKKEELLNIDGELYNELLIDKNFIINR